MESGKSRNDFRNELLLIISTQHDHEVSFGETTEKSESAKKTKASGVPASVASSLVPSLTTRLLNVKNEIEKDIDNFKLPGLPSVGEIKASLTGEDSGLGIVPRTFLTDILKFPELFPSQNTKPSQLSSTEILSGQHDVSPPSLPGTLDPPIRTRKEGVAPTKEGGGALSRILPSDPVNSFLGLLSSQTGGVQRHQDTASHQSAGSGHQVAGSGILDQFLTPPQVPSLSTIRANIKSLLAGTNTIDEKKVVESSDVVDNEVEAGDHTDHLINDQDLYKDNQLYNIEFQVENPDNRTTTKVLTEGVTNITNIEEADTNTDDNTYREDKKIFDDEGAESNKIDKKLQIPTKQYDHQNYAAFSLSSLVNSTFQGLWNQSFQFPILKHISEDFSKVSEIIANRTSMLAQHQNFNSSTLKKEWDNLHFTHHVKNASEEIKKFRLPGLPSIGDLVNKTKNISSKLQNITSFVSPLTVLRTLTDEMKVSEPRISERAGGGISGELGHHNAEIAARNAAIQQFNLEYDDLASDIEGLFPDADALLSNDIQDEIGDMSLEEYLLERFMKLVNNSFVNLKYSLDTASKVFSQERSSDISDDVTLTPETPPFTYKNISYSLLQGIDSLPVPASLQGLVNPEVDVANIEKVLRIIPHLFPYIMQDYKDRFHGLFVGTKLTQEQLFEIHNSLVDWHNKIESVRGELPKGEIHRILGLLQDNNVVLMYLVLDLMVEAGLQDNGKVNIRHHHLRVIDRHLLKADDLFPGLKDLL